MPIEEKLIKRQNELMAELSKADQEISNLNQRLDQMRTIRDNIRGALLLAEELLNNGSQQQMAGPNSQE